MNAFRQFAAPLLSAWVALTSLAASLPAQSPLVGTQPLMRQGDLSAQMVAGMSHFIERQAGAGSNTMKGDSSSALKRTTRPFSTFAATCGFGGGDFQGDNLHLNATGQAAWAAIIQPFLQGFVANQSVIVIQ